MAPPRHHEKQPQSQVLFGAILTFFTYTHSASFPRFRIRSWVRPRCWSGIRVGLGPWSFLWGTVESKLTRSRAISRKLKSVLSRVKTQDMMKSTWQWPWQRPENLFLFNFILACIRILQRSQIYLTHSHWCVSRHCCRSVQVYNKQLWSLLWLTRYNNRVWTDYRYSAGLYDVVGLKKMRDYVR